MRILVLHNNYREAVGGEIAVARAEKALLEEHGHDVQLLLSDNADISGVVAHVRTAVGSIYSVSSYKLTIAAIKSFRPHVIHVHNFFPLFSPAVYYASRSLGVPVVQTLHNYRLACAGGQFFRDGKTCEKCLHSTVFWSGIWHACYKRSHLLSAITTAMVAVHRPLGTWNNLVDMYIAPSKFLAEKMVESGLPAEKMIVKPNFLQVDPGAGRGEGGYALFVGRLSAEKGISTLLEAWELLGTQITLKVVGDGPMAEEVRTAVARNKKNIQWLGTQPQTEVKKLMADATCLIVPSIWYEGLPMVTVEALAFGTPLIASRIGALGEVVHDNVTGLLFQPGDAEDLACKVKLLFAQRTTREMLRRNARADFERRYTSQRNYELLIDIYSRVTGKILPGAAHA